MTQTDRVLVAITNRLGGMRAAIDSTPDLNSVTVTVQIDRFGPGLDKVVVQSEAGHQTKPRLTTKRG